MKKIDNTQLDLLALTTKICADNYIKPARTRGQNFLINEGVYNDIIAAANLTKDDVVLEIGPGLGFLTQKLAEVAKKVVAVELDDKLAVVLRDRLDELDVKNVEIINKNILDFDDEIDELLGTVKYKIVANLPYNITSVFLRKFLSARVKPESLVLMLQKEVAERICATVSNMSILAASVQYFAKPEIVQTVPASDFWPAPEVNSAIIKIDVNKTIVVSKEEEKEFFRLVKVGFAQKRKMLKNNLMNGFHLSAGATEEVLKKANFDLKVRAQELSVEDWKRLGLEIKNKLHG